VLHESQVKGKELLVRRERLCVAIKGVALVSVSNKHLGVLGVNGAAGGETDRNRPKEKETETQQRKNTISLAGLGSRAHARVWDGAAHLVWARTRHRIGVALVVSPSRKEN
jgi:hypothetical protein